MNWSSLYGGYGHGVGGMSQYGAQEMALAGYAYADILQYYYQGIELKKNVLIPREEEPHGNGQAAKTGGH